MPNNELINTAKQVAADWEHQGYYSQAEDDMEAQWKGLIWPIIRYSDFSVSLDLAAGHGRNTKKLLEVSERVIAVDVNKTNTDFIAERFSGLGEDRLRIVHNDGATLDAIPDASVTFFYSFDAMVHFDSDVVRSYIREAKRVLAPGGRAFMHYSNNTSNPTGTYRDHAGWRNFMSQQLFEHWLAKEDLEVLRSCYARGNIEVTTTGSTDVDSVTYFCKPAYSPRAIP